MAEQSDHDLLVRLDTKVEILIKQVTEMTERYESRITNLTARVVSLENQDSRDSERFRAITDDVQRSLANHQAIQVLETKLDTLDRKVDDAYNRSRLWDILIAVGATASFLANLFIK